MKAVEFIETYLNLTLDYPEIIPKFISINIALSNKYKKDVIKQKQELSDNFTLDNRIEMPRVFMTQCGPIELKWDVNQVEPIKFN